MASAATASSFGKLPHVPFLSLLEIEGNAQENIESHARAYAFVIVDDKLSIEETCVNFPQGETDLAKVAQFIRSHFDQLPRAERFLIPKQINFLIQDHNEKGGLSIEELSGPEEDLSYSQVLDRLKDPIKKLVGDDTQAEEKFYQDLEKNLAKFPRVDNAVYHTIRHSTFTFQQKQDLAWAVESLSEVAFRAVRHLAHQAMDAYLQVVWAVLPEKILY
jgi:hypothetical protein